MRCVYGCLDARLYACGYRCAEHAPQPGPPTPDPKAAAAALHARNGRPSVPPRPVEVPDRANARRTDPATSHRAAASVKTGLRESQRQVLEVLQRIGPSCDERIRLEAARMGISISPSGMRTRRAELVDAGYVRDTGRTVTLESGRSSIVWQACPVGWSPPEEEQRERFR